MLNPSRKNHVTGAASAALRAAGMSVTMPRLAVWMALEQAPSPLAAGDIARGLLRSGLEVPLSSIYAALKRLTDAGLVKAHAFEGGKAHFALANRQYAQCLTCEHSGQTFWPVDEDGELALAISRFCQKHGFALHQYSLSLQVRPLSVSPLKERDPSEVDHVRHTKPGGDNTHEDEVPAVFFGAG